MSRIRPAILRRKSRVQRQLEQLESRLLLSSVLIPEPDHNAVFYDATRNQLDIAGTGGTLYRYDLIHSQFLTPIQVGGTLGNGDITPDGRFLYLTDTQSSRVHKIDLTTGATSTLYFAGQTVGWDLVITSDDQAIMDTSLNGEGTVPLRPIDLTSDTIGSQLANGTTSFWTNSASNIVRSADRSTLYVSSMGYIDPYFYGVQTSTQSFATGSPESNDIVLNRDGSLLAIGSWANSEVLNRNLTVLDGGLPAGQMAFSPTRDRLYLLPNNATTVSVYDTMTFSLVQTFDVGEQFASNNFNNSVTVSPDGNTLFVMTSSGVRIVDVRESPLRPTLTLSSPSVTSGATLTLTASIASSATGSIRFMDGATVLGTVPLSGTSANFTVHTLGQGVHSLSATFVDSSNISSLLSNISAEVIVPASAPANLIAEPDHSAVIYDATRNQLDIAGSGGTLYRYDMISKQFLPAIQVGGTLGNGDITPDGHYLYLTDTQTSLVHKVDLATGATSNITYGATNAGEITAWDLVITSNDQAFLDSSYGQIRMPVQPMDLSTDTIGTTLSNGTNPYYTVDTYTNIFRSADRSTIYFTSSGDPFLYDVATNAKIATAYATTAIIGGENAALSRDGSLVAVNHMNATSILNRNMNVVGGGFPAGQLAFSPTHNRLYLLPNNSTTLNVYDTTTFALVQTLSVGEGFSSNSFNDCLTVSSDGNTLFVMTATGIRVVDIRESAVLPTLELSSPSVISGASLTLTASVLGAVSGSISFMDGTTVLATVPLSGTSATFVTHALAQGVHALSATFVDSSNARSLLSNISAEVIRPATASPNLIAEPDHAEVIYDDTGDQLDIVGTSGTLYRYDLISNQFLPSIQVGGTPGNGDITPDGRYLYLTDTQTTLVHKVDLTTGVTSVIGYGGAGAGGEDAAWDLVITSNSQALLDSAYGEGTVPVRQLDLTTGAISQLVNGTTSFWTNARTNILRSADDSTLFFDSMYYESPILYDVPTNSVISLLPAFSGIASSNNAALNRDGSLLACGLWGASEILDRSFNLVEGGLPAGEMAFSPTRDRLYLLPNNATTVSVYDTTTFNLVETFNVGEGFSSNNYNNSLTVSTDGNTLFVMTSSGVRVVNVNEGPFPTPTLTLSDATADFGQTVTLTAKLAPGVFSTLDSIAFKDGSTLLGIQQINASGSASLAVSSLITGNHNFTVTYQASNGAAGAPSASVGLTIDPINPIVGLSVATPGMISHAPVFNVTVSGITRAIPGGTVDIYEGTALLGSAALTHGTAQVSLTNPLPIGLNSLTAHYEGDNTYLAGNSSALTVAIEQLMTTTALTSPRLADVPGSQVTLNAHVTPSAGTVAGGSVSFFEGSTLLGSSAADSDGDASFVTSALAAGDYQFTAVYGETSDFKSSSSSPLAVAIRPVASTTALTSSAANSAVGTGATFTATVSADASEIPSGQVTFFDGIVPLGTVALDVNGSATFTSSSLTVGAHQITAAYGGSSVFLASNSSAVTQNVMQAYTIDLLALYTPQEAYDAGDSILSNIQAQVDDTNQALANSDIPVTIRLVGLSEVNYRESGNLQTDWSRLQNPHDGYMDNVAKLRNALGADLVVLMDSQGSTTNNWTTEGVGSQLTNLLSPTRDQAAYMVIDASSPEGSYVLAHEIGHTLGATHALGDPQDNGISADAHGYRFVGNDGNTYRDIMAYDPGRVIPYYSDPDLTYAGQSVGKAGTANAARVIRMTAPSVAAYRNSVPVGLITSADASLVSGWVLDPKDFLDPTNVRIDVDGKTLSTFSADEDRGDLNTTFGSTAHGFSFALPNLSSGKHTIRVYAADSVTGTWVLVDSRTITGNHLVFLHQPGAIVAGHSPSVPVTVAVENTAGHLVTTYNGTLTIGLTGGTGGTLGDTRSVPVINGIATFSDLSLTMAGTYTLSASDGLLDAVKSNKFIVSPEVATGHLVLTQRPAASVVVGSALLPALTLAVQDQYGNVIKTDHSKITLSIFSGPTSGLLIGATTVTAKAGVANFNIRALTAAGTYVLTVSSPGPAVATTVQFDETATPATSAMSTPKIAKAGYASGTTAGMTCTLTAQTQTKIPFGGTVELVDSAGDLLGSGNVSSTGGVKLAFTVPASGNCTCHLAFSGDDNHNPCTSSTFTLISHRV